VITERRHSFAVEDAVYADFQLFLARKALSSNELKSFAGNIPPLVYLFGKSSWAMNVGPDGSGSVNHVVVAAQASAALRSSARTLIQYS